MGTEFTMQRGCIKCALYTAYIAYHMVCSQVCLCLCLCLCQCLYLYLCLCLRTFGEGVELAREDLLEPLDGVF